MEEIECKSWKSNWILMSFNMMSIADILQQPGSEFDHESKHFPDIVILINCIFIYLKK